MEIALITGLGLLGQLLTPNDNHIKDNWNNITNMDTSKLPNKQNNYEESFEASRWLSKNEPLYQNDQATNKWEAFDISKNMTYNMVSNNELDDFKSSLLPNTTQRDFEQFNDSNEQRQPLKLELFSGSSKFYFAKKETEPFFQPANDVSFPHGAPNIMDKVVNRYIDGLQRLRNGERAFEPEQISSAPVHNKELPNLLHDYSRVLPKDINELRRANDTKVSYSYDVQPGKAGDNRPIVAPPMKRRPEKFKEMTQADLQPSSCISHPSASLNFTIDDTNRTSSTEVWGPAQHHTKLFNITTSGEVQPSSKDIYTFDTNKISNSTKAYNSNIESFELPTLARNTTQIDYSAVIPNTLKGVSFDPNNIANITNKQLLNVQSQNMLSNQILKSTAPINDKIKHTLKSIQNDQFLGPITNFNKVITQPTDDAKITNRQTIENFELNTIQGNNNIPAYQTDIAKLTNRQTIQQQRNNMIQLNNNVPAYQTDLPKYTTRQTNKQEINNFIQANSTIPAYLTDITKLTNRQTIENFDSNVLQGNNNKPVYQTDLPKNTTRQTNKQEINNFIQANSNITAYLTDIAKITNKQSINYQYDNINSSVNKNIVDIDAPRQTIKQFTVSEDFISGPANNYGNSAYQSDPAKTTSRQTINYKYDNVTTGVNKNIVDVDAPKQTIRQITTIEDHINPATNAMASISYLSDKPKNTHKQNTISNNYDSVPFYANNTGYQSNIMEAKTTLKEVTKLEDYIGIGGANIGNYNNEEYLNANTYEAREVIASNRKNEILNCENRPEINEKGEFIRSQRDPLKFRPDDSYNLIVKETFDIPINDRLTQIKNININNIDNDKLLRMKYAVKNKPSYNKNIDLSILDILDNNPIINNMVNHKNRV